MKDGSWLFFEAFRGFEISGTASSKTDVDADKAGDFFVGSMEDRGKDVFGIANVVLEVEEGLALGASFKPDNPEDSTLAGCWTGTVSEIS